MAALTCFDIKRGNAAMNTHMFDKVIAELESLQAQIAAINARPFMPDTPSQIAMHVRHLKKTRSGETGSAARAQNAAGNVTKQG